MSDLTESRISEIRERLAAHKQTDDGSSVNARAAAAFQLILHAPADLEALLAEREGMKAEIERLNARLAWRDHRDSCHPCGSHVRAMCEQGVEIYSRTQTRAPLDPSSAPGIGRIVARYASETRRLRAELESARSPEREAGSGTDDAKDAERWRFVRPRLVVCCEEMMSGKYSMCLSVGIGQSRLAHTPLDALNRDVDLAIDRELRASSEGGGE